MTELDAKSDLAILQALDLMELAEKDSTNLTRRFAHMLTTDPRQLYEVFCGFVSLSAGLVEHQAKMMHIPVEFYIDELRGTIFTSFGQPLPEVL